MTEMETEICVESLPTQLQRIINAVGLEATERLLSARGGSRLWRPVNEEVWEQQAELIGSRELVEAFWGEFSERTWIQLPTLKKIEAMRRNARIRSLRGQSTAREVAMRFRITSSYVRMIWASND